MFENEKGSSFLLYSIPVSSVSFYFNLLERVAAQAGFAYRLRLVPDNCTARVTRMPDSETESSGSSWIGSSSTHVCGHETKLLTNQFSVCNSLWFITGTFLRQGSGLNPKATSTRIVGGIWWFFTLIILSSYTANLAAFLTVERTVLPIQSAADLAAQNSVQDRISLAILELQERGVIQILYDKWWKNTGDVCNRDGKDSKANPLGVQNIASPPALVSSYEDGVRRVLQGNYAFLMESTMLDHRVQRDCNLTQIGGLLDSKELRTAMRGGSSSRTVLRPGCSRCSPATHVPPAPSRYEVFPSRSEQCGGVKGAPLVVAERPRARIGARIPRASQPPLPVL
ncbi:hypothetical protein MSG28_014461 [Choristoneura fumiferana]|uniref:Uncharacterized protein n=1 Tax=Choristoneura fumiferana TaxID=7141 RepID=A0ACC0JRI7_CHOFU|nr:hypothetical protein MSG28_014461 [Choristoneura fumiferana]